MNDQNIQLQIFYELAMAVGNSLDLRKMLKQSLQAYLRKLDFSAGIVFQVEKKSNGYYSCEQIMSIPYRIHKNATFQTALKEIPQSLEQNQWSKFLEKLPIMGSVANHHAYSIMALPGFGLVMFIFGQNKMPVPLMKALMPINNKLGQACNACLSNQRIIDEIEKRKQSEQTALESKRRLKKILETVQAGIVIVDVSTHKIVDANPTALAMINGTREQIIGKKCHQYICPDEIGKCPVTDLKQVINNSEKKIVTTCGENIPVLKSVVHIELSGRQCLLESFIDLRRLKKAEKERDEIERMFMQAQKLESLGRLSGGIAHDFNNILNAANGYTELALDDVPKGSQAAMCLENIMAAHKRAMDLVKQILTFSRATNEKRNPIQMRPVLEEAIKLIRKTIPATIEIRKNISNKCGYILADETRIHQIIINLCTNASHAMQNDGGVLTIKLRPITVSNKHFAKAMDLIPGHYVRLTVADTGEGMDEQTKKRIFEPFFTTKEIGLGTGMGLSTVHGIVKNYGGSIHVRSKINQGSTFNIYFPCCIEEKKTRQTEKKIIPLNGKEKILFVDDDKEIARVFEMTLTRSGYTASSYTSSIKALEVFHANPDQFDLVMTDMNMPKLTGVELAKKMLDIRPDIPIILCTGYTEKMTRKKALKLGLKELVSKPISRKELVTVIRSVLDDKTAI